MAQIVQHIPEVLYLPDVPDPIRHQLNKSHGDLCEQNEAFYRVNGIQDLLLRCRILHMAETVRLIFLLEVVELRNALGPEVVPETSKALLKFAEEFFNRKSVCVQCNDEIGCIRGQSGAPGKALFPREDPDTYGAQSVFSRKGT